VHAKFRTAEKRTIWRANSTRIYQDDHLFVSRDLAEAMTNYDVADRAGVSDHSPVVVTLASRRHVGPTIGSFPADRDE
jgi:exonuclease III